MPSIRKITAETFNATEDAAESTVKHPLIGSVSMGTEDTSTLIERFMAVLRDHNHVEYAELQILVDLATDDDMLDQILDTIYTAMESLAMQGYYFGADGMGNWNYGYWIKTW